MNECEDGNNGGCDHMCNNYDGGFNCSCDNGYDLSKNGKDCIGKKCFVIHYFFDIIFYQGIILDNKVSVLL